MTAATGGTAPAFARLEAGPGISLSNRGNTVTVTSDRAGALIVAWGAPAQEVFVTINLPPVVLIEAQDEDRMLEATVP